MNGSHQGHRFTPAVLLKTRHIHSISFTVQFWVVFFSMAHVCNSYRVSPHALIHRYEFYMLLMQYKQKKSHLGDAAKECTRSPGLPSGGHDVTTTQFW